MCLWTDGAGPLVSELRSATISNELASIDKVSLRYADETAPVRLRACVARKPAHV